jgi:hypothetical protein
VMHYKSVTIIFMIVLISFVDSGNAGGLQEVGLGVGPNFGYLAYDNPMEIWDVGWALGFTFGVYFEISLSNRISFVPCMRFSNLSNKVELVDSAIKGEFKANHKLISLPLLFRYELKENIFFIDSGPEFSLFLSSEMQNDYVELGNPNIKTKDISNEVESYDIGACIRIGFKAYQWNIPIAVTASYHHGFRGVAVEDEWWSDWKMREITLSVSYLFDLSK